MIHSQFPNFPSLQRLQAVLTLPGVSIMSQTSLLDEVVQWSQETCRQELKSVLPKLTISFQMFLLLSKKLFVTSHRPHFVFNILYNTVLCQLLLSMHTNASYLLYETCTLKKKLNVLLFLNCLYSLHFESDSWDAHIRKCLICLIV